MTVYSYISINIDRIKKETAIGMVPCSILRHWEIYSRYDAYKKMSHSVVEAVLFAAQDMKVSERIVFRIIKRMEQEVYEGAVN